MTPFELKEMFVLGICNLVVGPLMFTWGIYSELEIYEERRRAKKELRDTYNPVFWAYGFLIFCSFFSGLFAMCAVTVFRNDCDWEIKLGRLATFLAKAIIFQILAIFFYNFDPMGWRTRDGFLGSWVRIKLPCFTYFYCLMVQYYFVKTIGKFVEEAKDVVKLQ
ncbi:uncharacterized protein LOC110849792 [Folsomia candida]|uniref:uncharacterized protein LOC110849792 n=1 Tax=Folsomia candida TaxID=158441 RepID=UPI000B8FCE40|nr:uncharacterized protein LOC110849792 [Folsomia candida]